MSCSIAAATTSGGGLISTADATGSLDIKSGTTTIVAVTSAGVSVTGTLTASGAVTLTTVLPVASGGTGVSTSTGSGANVLGTSPTMATPTFDSAQLATVVGTAPLYMARAWVNFNGTGTVAIRASGNVSSVADNAVGDYSVNFTTALSAATFSCVVTGKRADNTTERDGDIKLACAYAAASVRITTHTSAGAASDQAIMNVAFHA